MKVYLGFFVRKNWVSIGVEPRDWWVGYYRGDTHHYVCPLPCLVIRWRGKDLQQLEEWAESERAKRVGGVRP